MSLPPWLQQDSYRAVSKLISLRVGRAGYGNSNGAFLAKSSRQFGGPKLRTDFIDRDLCYHHSSERGLIRGKPKPKLKKPINMKKSLTLIVVGTLSFVWGGFCSAQSDAPYTEGP